MYCYNCGKEIDNSSKYCPYCNSPIGMNPNREANLGLKILSFIFPFLGLIFYLCFDMDTPIRSKQCGKCALAGFLFMIIVIIILYIIVKITFTKMVTIYFLII